MSEDDDDLPILTQVLRIGGGRAGAASVHATDEYAFEDGSASALDEILLTDQLVIGTEPRQELEPYVPLTTPTFDPAARHEDSHAQSPTQSLTRSSIVPFTEPVDVQTPSDGKATLETSSAEQTETASTGASAGSSTESSASLSDSPADAVLLEAAESSAQEVRAGRSAESETLLAEEAGPERRDAANDADDDGDDASRDAAVAIEPASVPEVASADESALVDASTPPPFDHDAFAVRVREAVLNDLSARIDTELDARIAQTMRAELEAALASLQDNLREQLAEAMRDVVRRAVEEQVARLRKTHGE